MSLSDKQQRFVDEYLIDLNAKQAAIRAGYSAKTAEVQGSRLLTYAKVKEAVAARQATIAEKLELTQEMVAAELRKIGFANMYDFLRVTSAGDPYLDLSVVTPDQGAAIGEVTVEDFTDGRGDDAREVRRVKVKLHDKRAALVDLGRHLGMFAIKVDKDTISDFAQLLADADRRAAGR